jgi:CRP-like cAMP-binding protein
MGLELFESLDADQLEKLLTIYMEIRFIENGQVVLVPDEPINALYLVISGTVDFCVSQNN